MGVVESAARLFERLAATGDEFTRYLRPGLSTERMDDLLGRAGLPQPPADVLEFYGAVQPGPGIPVRARPAVVLRHLLAVELRGCTRRVGPRRANEYAEPPWQDAFPFLQEDDNVYLVEIQPDENGNHRVIDGFSGEIPAATFSNLAAMFDTFTEWLSSGALNVDHGRVPGFYEGDKRQVYQVAARLNPGVGWWADPL